MQMLGLDNAELSIVFVGGRRMRSLNAQYRGIDKVTDVLSFPQGPTCFNFRKKRISTLTPSSQSLILGDIVICVPRAESQAEEFGSTFYHEMMRLIIHGLLHLTGYDHEAGSYRKKVMVKKEKELLHAVTTVD